MRKSSKIIVLTMIGILSGAVFCWAQSASFNLGVSSENIRVDGQVEMDYGRSVLYAGAGGLYIEDDYTLYHLKGGLKQTLFAPALTLGMGFKGVMGEAEVYYHDYDITAIGFNVLGEFDFARTPAAVPVTLSADIVAAPDPLSYNDCGEYIEYTIAASVNIIDNGAIVAGYTKIETELKANAFEFDKDEDSVFLGFQLMLDM
ncbi:MAG: hypothetical protein SWH61_08775 [Thermodesulfobacteriota bacterium]|nr:hypothetical protein [Thermodesulfobacteriota bacterium]